MQCSLAVTDSVTALGQWRQTRNSVTGIRSVMSVADSETTESAKSAATVSDFTDVSRVSTTGANKGTVSVRKISMFSVTVRSKRQKSRAE